MPDAIRTKNYTGPDRRKNLPTLELWQENIKALNQLNLYSCRMRYAMTPDGITFLLRFEDQIPVGALQFVFPDVDRDRLVKEGWVRFVLTLTVTVEGTLAVDLWGRYERDTVPLDVKVAFVRDIGLGVGVGTDEVTFTDARDGTVVASSFKEIIEARLKTGEPKYARKDDRVHDISVEGMVAVLTRYLKDSAVRRRVLPSAQNPAT